MMAFDTLLLLISWVTCNSIYISHRLMCNYVKVNS